MARFELTGELMTGFQDIDEQHRTILELGSKVVELPAIQTNEKLFEEALRYLAGYVLYHFAAEESVMLATWYPNYEHHRRWHERFKRDISDYRKLAAAKDVSRDLRLKISFAIDSWLDEHVRITDRELAKFLQQQGGASPVRLPNARDLKETGKLPEDFDLTIRP